MCVIIVEVTINIPYSLEIAPLQLKAPPLLFAKKFLWRYIYLQFKPPYVQFTAL